MNDDFYFYKGLNKVKVITKSEGYWIVEAVQEFEDYSNGCKIKVKVGEQRIVEPSQLYKEKNLSPPIPEHVYEHKLEEKVKKMVEKYEKTENTKK